MRLAEPHAPISRPRRTGTLTGYAAFHLNLMFSSIEEAQRPEVIARCYEPLLDLAESGVPLGIEASGLTLEIAAAIAPRWIDRLRRLVAGGAVEFIGSGYAQAIGPLMPAQVVAKNLALGREVYAEILAAAPAIALVNEQTWSGGLVPLYREAGYRALIMDWDDPAAHHPEWSRHWRYHPQLARGADGGTIGLLWSNTIAFQKLQRFAHGDIDLTDYAEFVTGARASVDRVLALYTNDAECFGFRPGRYMLEDAVRADEWAKVALALRTVAGRGVHLALPSEALKAAQGANANQVLTLEAPTNPVPVKKQPKYNLTRWASSGRDDLWANSKCHEAYRMLAAGDAPDRDWRTLCRLWSSDYRTHITEARWTAFKGEVSAFVDRLLSKAPPSGPSGHPGSSPGQTLPLNRDRVAAAGGREESATPRIERGERFIVIETPSLRVVFDQRRGLAIDSMGLPHERALIGALLHGTIDDIALSADWYTGNAVFEGPGEPKVTDLERCTPDIAILPDGCVNLRAIIPSPLGPIHKAITVSPDQARIEVETRFDWPGWGKGSLRLGHVTLKPEAFDMAALRYRTHNGGTHVESFPLGGQTVDLGAPVSFLISCRAGIGMTEGWLSLDDGLHAVTLESDLATAATIGLIEHKVVHGQTFCRMMLSGLEMDETRRPDQAEPGPRTFRMAITLTKVNGY